AGVCRDPVSGGCGRLPAVTPRDARSAVRVPEVAAGALQPALPPEPQDGRCAREPAARSAPARRAQPALPQRRPLWPDRQPPPGNGPEPGRYFPFSLLRPTPPRTAHRAPRTARSALPHGL